MERGPEDVLQSLAPAWDGGLRFFLDRSALLMGLVVLADDGDLLHTYDNPAAARFFGLEHGQTQGRTARELGAPDEAIDLWRSHYERAAATGAPSAFEYVHRAGGQARVLSVTVSAMAVQDPEAPRQFGYIAEDVTEQRLAEALRLESEASLRAVFEQAAVGMALVATDGRWLRVNPRLCAMLGYEPEEFVGLTFADLSHPDDLPDDMAQVQRLLAGDATTYNMEKRYFRKDGAVLWARLNVTLIRDAAGQPDRFISVVEDITDRKAIEDELRAAERRLSMAAQAAKLGVWEWEFGASAAHYSPRAREICGFAPDGEVHIADILERVVAEDRDRISARTETPRSATDGPASVEYRIQHPESGVRWVRATSTVVVGEDKGEAQGARLFGTLEDITEQRENEERLGLLMREVDHRANNLLTVVQSIVALSRGVEVEAFREVLAGRVAALARAHQLLAGARWAAADLRRLVEEELKPYGLGEDGRILTRGPEGVALSPAQAQALALVLHELATNAAKHGALAGPQGRVELEWRVVEGKLDMIWREAGGPPVTPPRRTGFGATVLGRSLGGSLRGEIDLDWATQGLRARLRLPLSSVQGEPG